MTTAAREPRWQLDDALRRARTANRLAVTHLELLTPRLSPGLLDGLTANRAVLGDASARRTTALTDRKTATRHEREVAADGCDLALTIRNAVKRTAMPPRPCAPPSASATASTLATPRLSSPPRAPSSPTPSPSPRAA